MVEPVSGNITAALRQTSDNRAMRRIATAKPSELRLLAALANYEGLEHNIISRYLRPFITRYGADGLRQLLLCLFNTSFFTLQEMFQDLRNVRVLDLGCGSNGGTVDYEIGFMIFPNNKTIRGTNPFEPWLCRVLHLIGAKPVGIDIGSLDGEAFEHYNIDLREDGCLGEFPDFSFDVVNATQFFNSPSFDCISGGINGLKANIEPQIKRILKPKGQYITRLSKPFDASEVVFDDVGNPEEANG
jgi:SAM-dependent methyltransferase